MNLSVIAQTFPLVLLSDAEKERGPGRLAAVRLRRGRWHPADLASREQRLLAPGRPAPVAGQFGAGGQRFWRRRRLKRWKRGHALGRS